MLTDSTVYKIKKGGETLGVFPFCLDAKYILTGFSGGADSSLLLSFFVRMREICPDFPKVIAIHVNHMLRGAESDRDEEFCRSRAKTLDVPIIVRRIDVPSLMRERGLGAEECARDARYAVFSEIADSLRRGTIPNEMADAWGILTDDGSLQTGDGPAPKVLIATAHNADDNFETVLFNLTRGGGAGGLSGIPPVREDGVIRPLLSLGSDEIRKICRACEIPFVTDSTNSDALYTRNFIRKEVIPLLKKVNPSATDAVIRAGISLREDGEYLRSAAAAAVSAYLPPDGVRTDEISVPRDVLKGLSDPVLSRAIVMMVSSVTPIAMGAEHIRTARRILSQPGTGKVSLPDGVTLEVSKHAVTAERPCPAPVRFHIPLEIPNGGDTLKYECPEAGFDLYISRNLPDIPDEFQNIYKLSIHTSVRFDTIYGRIYARPRLPGDTVILGGHKRKLKKLMCDAGIPESRRDRLPIICDERGIIAVPQITRREKGDAAADGFLHVLYCPHWRI